MAATDPKETIDLRQIHLLFVALCLASCATNNCTTAARDGASSPPQAQAVLLDVYEMIQCAGCDSDFQRVALPDAYELPTEDLGECFAYVLDQNPDDRDLLLSAWMECVERVPD